MGTNRFRIAVRTFGPFESAIRKQWEAFEAPEKAAFVLDMRAFDLDHLFEQIFHGGDWDLVFLNTDWIAAAHEHDLLLDLGPFLDKAPPDGYPGAWADSLLRLQTFSGKVLGVPYHDGPECLIYRTDLVDKPPEIWQEFHELARRLSRRELNLYGTAFAAYPDGHNTVYDFLLQLWTRGSDDIRIDSPIAAEALHFYRSVLNDPQAVHPKCREMDSVASGLAFARGEIAMMVNWFGFAAYAHASPDSKVKGRVDIAAVPHGSNAATSSLNVYWLLAIPKSSSSPELAYDFIRQCAGMKMDRLLTFEGGIGCRRSTWSDAEVNRRIPFFHKLEALHQDARELPRRSDWPEIAKQIERHIMSD